ncbi:unnamed protein product [Bursaphelenchus xylophilus]|uniref:(pine wood nematode) hypothetical protein n=1 Tax=Bursaphelenchus xylophilus TaxID=6326 RepID=A0A1I7S4V8_BURXY|nr:unnamed protein product [Bursaphelenchus xylophilus]CAG9117415.1 unnamed protein product [Bursaphelenchus xylophilus]
MWTSKNSERLARNSEKTSGRRVSGAALTDFAQRKTPRKGQRDGISNERKGDERKNRQPGPKSTCKLLLDCMEEPSETRSPVRFDLWAPYSWICPG